MSELGRSGSGRHLEVDISTVDNASVLRVTGAFVGKQVALFRRACFQAQADEAKHRIIDLSGVEEIDGYGMAALVGLLARRRREGGEVVLCGLNPDLRSVLEATNCDSIYRMAVSTSGALEYLKDGKE